ncbi:MAG: hypothetical protein WC791_01350 [Candidatus Paceibacterota bacterium]|jgi:hypothetical protein
MDPNTYKFLYDWQQLIGAFLGPFLAIIFSSLSFYITWLIGKWRRYRETFRKIEVHTTYAMNSTVSMQDKLTSFVNQAKKLVADIRGITNPNEFALHTINFPALGEIHLFSEAPDIGVRSYFLHNKLLWAHSSTKDLNSILGTFSDGWSHIINLNNRLIDLTKDTPNPTFQRGQYAENIEIFCKEIERFSNDDLSKNLITLSQIKIYNEMLRQSYFVGSYNLWKNEGLSFKYFRTYSEHKAFSRNLESIERIEGIIQDETTKLLSEIEERHKKINNI